jgi:phage tail sheath gpL-like
MADLVPGTFISISDLSVSTPATEQTKVLLIGIKLSTGTLAVNTPTRIYSDAEGDEAGGVGSQLAQMVRAVRRQNPRVHLTVVAVAAAVSTAATGTFTFGGTATTANPLIVQIEDETITVPLAIGDDQDAVALALDTVLGSGDYDNLHVTCVNADEVATLTARSHGIHGNGIWLANVKVPPGITSTIAAMASGAGSPDVDAALQSLGAVRYDYIVLPDTGSDNITDTTTYLDSRWLAANANDGHAIVGLRNTVGNLATFGAALDTKHISVFGDPYVPSSPWVQAAAVAALRWTVTNPKFSLHNENLTAIVPPKETQYLNPDDRNTLLLAGISAYHFVSGNVRVDRFVSLYKTNGLGLASDALLDVETKLTVSAIRQARMALLLPLIGKILVPDASAVAYDLETAPQIIDPEGIRTLLLIQYRQDFMPQGWVSDPEAFEEGLEVEMSSSTSVTFYTPDTINGILYNLEGTLEFTLSGS